MQEGSNGRALKIISPPMEKFLFIFIFELSILTLRSVINGIDFLSVLAFNVIFKWNLSQKNSAQWL